MKDKNNEYNVKSTDFEKSLSSISVCKHTMLMMENAAVLLVPAVIHSTNIHGYTRVKFTISLDFSWFTWENTVQNL